MNTKQLSTKINQINRKIKRQNKKINKNKKIIRKQKIRRGRKSKNMYAAYSKNFKKQFAILSQNGNYMRVKGRDLIYKIPDDIKNENNTNILTVIPANPAYWLGTRISAIASGYQNYRPIMFNVHYVPQCAVTQQGNVIGGTLWAMAPNSDNLQQTLRTSNGGMLTQCYKPGRSIVNLKRNLQFNLFRTGGKFDQESNPFIYIALSIATVDSSQNKILPGYFYVNYIYELRNPIGDSIKYFNSGLIKNQDYSGNYVNETLVNCSDNSVNLGTLVQKDNNKYYWHEKEIEINDESYVWYFSNQISLDSNGNTEPDNVLDIPYTRKITTTSTTITSPTSFIIISDDIILCLYYNVNESIEVNFASYSSEYVYQCVDYKTILNSHFRHIQSNSTTALKALDDDWTVNMVESA